MFTRVTAALFLLAAIAFAQDAPKFSTTEGDFTIHDFHFKSGETLPELRIHYTTLGKAVKDANGRTKNAVLILHGTGGSGHSLLAPQFANVLYGPGQLLDITKYFVILPDNIGHGKSSKPSDGMHAKFPEYDYDDMVLAQHELLEKGLGVNHLRLVMGTSMGCMHSWVWGETYPDFMDAMMPLACLPVEIAGRNRIWRKMIIDGIRQDPDWKNGDYTTQPKAFRTANAFFRIATSGGSIAYQKAAPTREKADKFLNDMLAAPFNADANDFLYQWDSSRDYDAAPELEKIQAALLAINSADDERNPPETGVMTEALKRVKNGKLYLLPASEQTRGHGTTGMAKFYRQQLEDLLQSAPRRAM